MRLDMDDIFAIMLDVAGLVTRGSDAARIEAQRIAGERGSRAATNALAVADQPVAAAAQAAERTPSARGHLSRRLSCAPSQGDLGNVGSPGQSQGPAGVVEFFGSNGVASLFWQFLRWGPIEQHRGE